MFHMEPSFSLKVAAEARAALARAGISQHDASLETGIPPATLSRLMNGKHPFRIDQLQDLTRLAGTTMLALIKAAEDQPASASPVGVGS